MRRVVVGVDFSEGSLAAVNWAAEMARGANVSLQLVCAWEHPWWAYLPPPVSITPVPPPDGVQESMHERLVALVDELDLTDIAADPIVAEGSAASALLAEASADDLMVVGSRGHGAALDTLLGSVSSRCVAKASGPVAVVPSMDAATRRDGPVVVGVDGSDNAAAALKWAADHTPEDREIVLAASWGLGPVFGIEGGSTDFVRILDAEKDRATAAASHAGGLLDEAGRVHRAVIEQGDARVLLGELADKASLMVVGSRGRSGIGHTLLGSVTTSLVHHPACVVVVVRHR